MFKNFKISKKLPNYASKLRMLASATVDWSNYIREVCAASLLWNPIRIGGNGMTVEIKESVSFST